jgi:hypothetical protein
MVLLRLRTCPEELPAMFWWLLGTCQECGFRACGCCIVCSCDVIRFRTVCFWTIAFYFCDNGMFLVVCGMCSTQCKFCAIRLDGYGFCVLVSWFMLLLLRVCVCLFVSVWMNVYILHTCVLRTSMCVVGVDGCGRRRLMRVISLSSTRRGGLPLR